MRNRHIRAARFHGPGRPLVVEEIPEPKPTGAEVVIRIAAADVCRSDVHIRSDEFPLPPDRALPATMGHENAGFVDEVGSEVTGLWRTRVRHVTRLRWQ